jgi:hypothetical protein
LKRIETPTIEASLKIISVFHPSQFMDARKFQTDDALYGKVRG